MKNLPKENVLKEILIETWQVARELLKILIPVLVIVKVLKEFGGIEILGQLLSPLMSPMGLPGEIGIVWAAGILTNIYGAIASLVSLQLAEPLTVAQSTVLGLMILLAHGLPVEIAICRQVGGVWKTFLALRLIGALVFGLLLNLIFSVFGLFQEPATIVWAPQKEESGILDWLLNQASTLGFTVFVLFCLLVLMRVIKAIGLLDFLAKVLEPVLRLTGISAKASGVAIIGLLAGITFGSGLLIAEAKKNELSQRDIFLTLCLLSLCHGVIEDTGLVLLIGANIWGVLVFRVVLSLIVIGIIARLTFFVPKKVSTATS